MNLLRQFKQALHYGNGRAYLILKQHPELPVDELLIEAALHNYDYDPQCSGTRARYMDELLSLRPNCRELMRIIAERFEADDDINDWDASQCYELLCTSPNAPAEAPAIVRRRFQRKHAEESDFGFGDIAQSQGMPGIVFLAEVVGQQLLDDPEDSLNSSNIFSLDESFPPEKLNWRAELEKLAPDNPAIAIFMSSVRKEDTRVYDRKLKPFGLKEIEELMRMGKTTARRFFQLSPSDKEKLREYFFAEQRNNQLWILCWVLNHSKGVTPAMIPRLYEISLGNNERLSWQAIQALGTLHHKDVRKIALNEISRKLPGSYRFFDLLEANWKNGDERLLIAIFNRLRSPFSRHSIILTFSDLEKIPASFREFLIRHSTCGSCRSRAVRTLLKHGKPSAELMEELRYDSNPEIREAVAAI